MYHSPSTKFSNQRQLIESMMYLSESEKVDLKKLTEAEVGQVSQNIIRYIFKAVEKFFDRDPALKEFVLSKGDVTKVANYNHMSESLKYLAKQSFKGNVNETILNLQTVHTFLIKNKSTFVEGFKQGNRNVQFYYCTLTITLFTSLAMLLTGLTEIGAGRNAPSVDMSNFEVDNIIFSNLKAAANDIKAGKSVLFIDESVKQGNKLTESFAIPIIFALCMSIFWFMRDIVVFFFKVRHNLSKWFESYSVFLEMRALALEPQNSKAAARYKVISDKFTAIANFIRVDADVANKEAVKDIRNISNSSTEKLNTTVADSDLIMY